MYNFPREQLIPIVVKNFRWYDIGLFLYENANFTPTSISNIIRTPGVTNC